MRPQCCQPRSEKFDGLGYTFDAARYTASSSVKINKGNIMSEGTDKDAMPDAGLCDPPKREPLLGLRPAYIAWRFFREERRAEVQAAIGRYTEAGIDVPYEWRRELGELDVSAYKDQVHDTIEGIMREQRRKNFKPRPA